MSKAIYVNVTSVDGPTAIRLKNSIRDTLRKCKGRITSIYRNPRTPEGHTYRFMRVHFETET